MISSTIIKRAIYEAQQSKHKDYKLGAVIFSNGKKIISSGRNHTQRSVKRINKEFLKWPTTVHAEVDAIIKSRCDLKRKKIFVVRINKKGQFLLAKPCKYCQMYLEYVGIRTVYYSIPHYPFIEKMKL